MRVSGAQIGAVAGVTALAIVVSVLSAVALQQGRPPTVDGVPSAPPTFEFGAETTSPTRTHTPAASAVSAAEERFLAVQGDRLWRATAGECGGEAPLVELSTDRGETWEDVTPPGAAQVLAVAALSDAAGEIVAAVGENCEADVLRTYTAGIEWSAYPRALSDMTFLSPADHATVVRPGADIGAPCEDPRNIRASRGVVGLVCDEIAYALLDDAWTEIAGEAIALDAVAGTIVLAHASDRCDGVAVARISPTLDDSVACFGTADPSKAAAISMLDGELALWSGQDVWLR